MRKLPRGVVWLLLVFSAHVWSEGRFIAVDGTGEIEVIPDVIRISYNVSQIHKNATTAKVKVEEISSQSVSALLALGVMEKDISSSSLNVDTAHTYDKNGNETVVGHRVQRDIEIVVRDISLYGRAIQALVDSQVSEITKVKADVSNDEELKRKALAKAAQNAQEQARFLAGQFGAELDKVRQIGKQSVRREFLLEEIIITGSRRESANIKSVPYEFKPGTVKISSQVYVEFDLK